MKEQNNNYMDINKLEDELLDSLEIMAKENTAWLLKCLFRYMIHESSFTKHQIYTECKNLLYDARKRLPSSAPPSLLDSLGEIHKTSYMEQFKTYQELLQWMEQLLGRIIDEIKKPGKNSGEEIVESVKKYAREHFDTANRQAVAEYFSINPSYLRQLFKSVTGENYIDYLTRIRIDEAKKMLLKTDYKVSYIAEKLGYSSNQHFSSIFRKYTGLKPFEYKKMNKI